MWKGLLSSSDLVNEVNHSSSRAGSTIFWPGSEVVLLHGTCYIICFGILCEQIYDNCCHVLDMACLIIESKKKKLLSVLHIRSLYRNLYCK